MGGIQPSEAKRLSYWEFTAMRHEWDLRHDRADDDKVEPPSVEHVRAAQAELYELGIAGKAVH